ncbi:MAG: hypothetical protein H3C47_00845 [Candidatus Cloacimonetes bacterium]|nr:hypothetical protein [Candidatus Cloacimonadota bacterium]
MARFIIHSPSVHLRRDRLGLALPLVLGALIILTLLIFAISQGSTETYRLSAIINHGNHANFMALGAAEEMHDLVWNMVSNPLDLSERQAVLEAVYGGGEFELDLLSKLKEAHKQEIKQKKAGTENKKPQTAVYEAKARFHNFQTLAYSANGLYSTPTPYYRSPDGQFGQPAEGKDYFGFVTYTVKAQHGIITKTMKQTRPVKIVDMKPMGREYVLFEMDTARGKKLNDGPPLIIWGNEKGRIRMDGPYQLDVGGQDDGKSGSGGFFSSGASCGIAGNSVSYPKSGQKWYDDAYVPTPKWLAGCIPWFNGGRPSSHFIGGISPQICCPLIPLGNDAMGMAAQPNAQTYLSANVPVTGQNFSMIGSPGAGAGTFPNWFQGIKYAANGKLEEAQGVADSWDPQEKFEVRHEGIIIANYKSWKLQKLCFCIPVYGYFQICIHGGMISEGGPIQDYYGFKGDKQPEVNWMATIIGAAVNLMSMGGATGIFEAGGMAMSNIGAIMQSVGTQLMSNFVTGMLGGGNIGAAGVVAPGDVKGAFPTGFRPMTRTAVRHFATLEEALWKKNTLLLDGTYWVDELVAKNDFEYVGHGYLASLAPETVANEVVLKKVTPKNPKKDNYLSIWYNTVTPTPLKVDAEEIEASIFSMPGIDPQKDLTLVGNLMCSNHNKDLMKSSLNIIYDDEKLAQEEEFYKDFFTISVSPKLDAFTTVIHVKPGGTGDDGVMNFVETL